MNRLTICSVRACAAAAAALCAVPAVLAQTAPARAPAARGLEEITGHGAPSRRTAARRAGGGQRRSPARPARRCRPRLDGPAGRRAEPQYRAGPRLGVERQHLHPRHRPARRAADVRSGRRRLCRWRVHVAHPGRAVRCPTSSGSKCCAARRARCTARTRSRGAIKLISKTPGKDPVFDADLTLGSYDSEAGPRIRRRAHQRHAERELRGLVSRAGRLRHGLHDPQEVQRRQFPRRPRDPALAAERPRLPAGVLRLHQAGHGAHARPGGGAAHPDEPGPGRHQGAGRGADHRVRLLRAHVVQEWRRPGSRTQWPQRHRRGQAVRRLDDQVDHGLSQAEAGTDVDIDATQYQLGDVKVFVDQNQLSEELQFLYDSAARCARGRACTTSRRTSPPIRRPTAMTSTRSSATR